MIDMEKLKADMLNTGFQATTAIRDDRADILAKAKLLGRYSLQYDDQMIPWAELRDLIEGR